MPPFPRTFPRRGEVYDIDFNPARGSEQAGVRPGVVVSNDVNNQRSPVVIVAALTTQQIEERRRYPVNVFVAAGELRYDGIILTNQLMTIAKDRIQRHRGNLRPHEIDELNRALAITLALPRGGASNGAH